jgi:16S rRNA U516 pseudouridylate synthase RsuA-like enzyme
VLINGETAKTGQTVDIESDKITVDGKPLATRGVDFWIVLNKPPGVLTTKTDPRGRRTVFDLVPQKPGLTYVGRLDYMTEGVLLFTTDGEAAHKLTHRAKRWNGRIWSPCAATDPRPSVQCEPVLSSRMAG